MFLTNIKDQCKRKRQGKHIFPCTTGELMLMRSQSIEDMKGFTWKNAWDDVAETQTESTGFASNVQKRLFDATGE